MQQITGYPANPGRIEYLIGLIVGAFLRGTAFARAKKQERMGPEHEASPTPLSALGLGALVKFVGVSFALPYFAAIDRFLTGDFASVHPPCLQVACNLLQARPILSAPALVAVLGERSRPLSRRNNGDLERSGTTANRSFSIFFGLARVADALLCRATGKGLF